MLSLSKKSLIEYIIFLYQRFLQFSKHSWNLIFGIAFSSLRNEYLILSMFTKQQPFKILFNRKVHHEFFPQG